MHPQSNVLHSAREPQLGIDDEDALSGTPCSAMM